MAREPKSTLTKRLNNIKEIHKDILHEKIVEGRKGDNYTVVITKNSHVLCNCLGFTHHKKCWHSSMYKMALKNKKGIK